MGRWELGHTWSNAPIQMQPVRKCNDRLDIYIKNQTVSKFTGRVIRPNKWEESVIFCGLDLFVRMDDLLGLRVYINTFKKQSWASATWSAELTPDVFVTIKNITWTSVLEILSEIDGDQYLVCFEKIGRQKADLDILGGLWKRGRSRLSRSRFSILAKFDRFYTKMSVVSNETANPNIFLLYFQGVCLKMSAS